ncbi:hypothetical protein Tco_0499479 [Tanacetum coccineum]
MVVLMMFYSIRIMDPNLSLGKICLGDDVIIISSDKVEGSGDWNSPEYQDTAVSKGKKVMSALSFYRMEINEISERYIAPCFVNSLEAFDGEFNLAFDENLISNEFCNNPSFSGRETAHALVEKKGELVEKLEIVKGKAECKKLKKELEEARLSYTFLRMQNERVERDLYWTRVRAHEFYQEMIHRGFVFEKRPNEAIDVPIKDEKSPLSKPQGSPPDV